VKIAPLVSATAELSDSQSARYARHISLPEIGLAGQRRLASARVLCVGAGGLGSPVLNYLAAAGVGLIGIVDFDLVDESNLQRQVIHSQSSIGMRKTQSAAQRIAEINPYCKVVLHDLKLTNKNVLEIFKDYDLIIDGTDNFPTRYLINDAAVLLNKPCIWGSIFQFDGQASIFWSEHGPCYRCLNPKPPEPGSVPSCSQAGVLGILCSTIGSIQATEAIKLITGIGNPLIGSIIIYDALEMEYMKLQIKKDPLCNLCGPQAEQKLLLDNYEEFCGEVSAITATQLKAKMDANEKFFLVDVREPHEWEIVRIPGATLIPLGKFIDGSALSLLPTDIPIIMHCRSGGRSATSLQIAKSAGFSDAVHVAGGVLAWVKDIDPTLPVY